MVYPICFNILGIGETTNQLRCCRSLDSQRWFTELAAQTQNCGKILGFLFWFDIGLHNHSCRVYIICLVVSNMNFIFHNIYIYNILDNPPTIDELIFFQMVIAPPTSNVLIYISQLVELIPIVSLSFTH